MSYIRYFPVNGTDDNPQFGGLADDLKNIIDGAVNQGRDAAGNELETFINSTPFKKVLDKVKSAAEDGVKKEAGKNALGLFGLAVGGGVVGGAVLKGSAGLIAACAILGGSLIFLMHNAQSAASNASK